MTKFNYLNVCMCMVMFSAIFSAKCSCPFETAFYRPQRSWGKVMFSQVCDSVHGGCLPQCMLGYHTPPPGADTPLGADNTPEQTPPRSRHPQSRHPPGSDTPQADTPQSRHPPPLAEHAGRYGQSAGGTHPMKCNFV